ncbi:MAG TPA: S41 family peptidase [Candidatus Deferrimicrobium sp.]|nr:S41 family peptidase [Candidatus Deferrimicrobium sp.]
MKSKLLRRIGIPLAVFCVLFNSLLILTVFTDYLHIGRLFQVTLLIRGHSLTPVSFGGLLDGATAGMVKSLKDPYSTYLSQDKFTQFREQLDGTFGGVGLVLDTTNENQLKVTRVLQGSPAERAGVKKGDIITSVDGQLVNQIKATKAADQMRGKLGSLVKLSIVRGTGNSKEYNLKREIITMKSVEGKLLKIPQTIGYIKINNFNQNTAAEMEDVLENLGAVKGVMLDLRDNTGGTLEAAVEVANHFVPKGPVVHLVDKSGKRETYEVGGGRLNVPLMVLVNGETASASEILAGAIQDTASGLIIGGKTFGKGVVQTIYELSGSSALKITTAKYLTPLGRDINKLGIIPDVVIEDKETQQGDQVYNKALQLLAEAI